MNRKVGTAIFQATPHVGSADAGGRLSDGNVVSRATARPQPSAGNGPAPTFPLSGLPISVVGAGRLGTTLALAFVQSGARIAGFVNRTAAGRARAETALALEGSGSVEELATRGGRLYLLTVPDDAIPDVARRLARALKVAGVLPADPPCTQGTDRQGSLRSSFATGASTPVTVLHTSGATPVTALTPLSDLGALTLSFHPLQTFSDAAAGPAGLHGCAIAVTPGPHGGWRLGRDLARAVGGRPFLLKEQHRILYHVAACLASNYLVTLAWVTEDLFRQAGIPADQALEGCLPLLAGTLENLARRGTIGALTGPLSRGDTGTIASHLEELAARRPQILPLYRILGLATLDIVRARDELPPTLVRSLQKLLEADSRASDGNPTANPLDSMPQAHERPTGD